MMLNKPKFWDGKIGFISKILYPFSLISILLIFLNKKLTYEKTFKVPIICIGNIYIGGTGKTPTSILIANELNKYGTKVAILRKYYKTHKDEYNLIKNYFQNLIISKKRINGLIEAEKNNYEVVILDD